jgi:hypothetical protein
MILWGRGWLLGLILKEFDDLSVACTLTTCFPPIFHVASFTLRFPRTRVVPKEAMPWSKFLGLFKAPFDRPYKIWLNKHWRSKYGGCPPAVHFVNPFQYSLSLNKTTQGHRSGLLVPSPSHCLPGLCPFYYLMALATWLLSKKGVFCVQLPLQLLQLAAFADPNDLREFTKSRETWTCSVSTDARLKAWSCGNGYTYNAGSLCEKRMPIIHQRNISQVKIQF